MYYKTDRDRDRQINRQTDGQMNIFREWNKNYKSVNRITKQSKAKACYEKISKNELQIK